MTTCKLFSLLKALAFCCSFFHSFFFCCFQICYCLLILLSSSPNGCCISILCSQCSPFHIIRFACFTYGGSLNVGKFKVSNNCSTCTQNSSNFIWSGSPINWITSSTASCSCWCFCIFIFIHLSSFALWVNCACIVDFQQYPFNISLCGYTWVVQTHHCVRSSIFRRNVRGNNIIWRTKSLNAVPLLRKPPLCLVCLFCFTCRLTFEFSKTQSFLITKSNTTPEIVSILLIHSRFQFRFFLFLIS